MIAVIRAAEAINPLPFTRNGPQLCMTLCMLLQESLFILKMGKDASAKHTHSNTAKMCPNVIDRPLRASEKTHIKTSPKVSQREKLRKNATLRTGIPIAINPWYMNQ